MKYWLLSGASHHCCRSRRCFNFIISMKSLYIFNTAISSAIPFSNELYSVLPLFTYFQHCKRICSRTTHESGTNQSPRYGGRIIQKRHVPALYKTPTACIQVKHGATKNNITSYTKRAALKLAKRKPTCIWNETICLSEHPSFHHLSLCVSIHKKTWLTKCKVGQSLALRSHYLSSTR